MNLYKKAIGWLAGLLAGLLGPIMEWSWKIRNLSLCSIIIEHCHLVHNFPPGSGLVFFSLTSFINFRTGKSCVDLYRQDQ